MTGSSAKLAESAVGAATRSPTERCHMFIFDQVFSSCSHYLATCDNHGYISIFKISSALSANANKRDFFPYFSFKASDKALYSLRTHADSLICGGSKALMCWSWSSLLSKVNYPFVISFLFSQTFFCVVLPIIKKSSSHRLALPCRFKTCVACFVES